MQTKGERESCGGKDAERWRVGEMKWDLERNKGSRMDGDGREKKQLDKDGGTPDGFHLMKTA